MESESKAIVNSALPAAPGELLVPGSSYTSTEIERLFERDSPLLRENPYALAAPLNTVRARRSDWRVFIRFCAERHYTPLPAAPAVVREFLEASFGGARASIGRDSRALFIHHRTCPHARRSAGPHQDCPRERRVSPPRARPAQFTAQSGAARLTHHVCPRAFENQEPGLGSACQGAARGRLLHDGASCRARRRCGSRISRSTRRAATALHSFAIPRPDARNPVTYLARQ